MKCRIIVECDADDVGRVLSALPRQATFTVTRSHTMPKVGPVGKAVVEAMTPKKKRRMGLKTARSIILEYLADHPGADPTLLTQVCIAAGHKKSSPHARMYEMVRDQLIYKEDGKYFLTGEGVSRKNQ